MFKKYFCDCGSQLLIDDTFESYVVDNYVVDNCNVILICNRYYCPVCGMDTEINEEISS